jgi:hypothetical protein
MLRNIYRQDRSGQMPSCMAGMLIFVETAQPKNYSAEDSGARKRADPSARMNITCGKISNKENKYSLEYTIYLLGYTRYCLPKKL